MRDMRRAFAAFGLIALLIVVVIILILYFGPGGGGGIAQQAAQTRGTVREQKMEISTGQLTPVIMIYYQNNNKLPASMADLELPPAATNDPWGNPMTFTTQRDARTGKVSVTYVSAGPDGEPGTDDDIRKTDDLPI